MPGAVPASTRRLTVIERSAEPGLAVDGQARAATPAELLDAVIAGVPPRLAIEPEPVRTSARCRRRPGPLRQCGRARQDDAEAGRPAVAGAAP